MHTRKTLLFIAISIVFSFSNIDFNAKNHLEKIYTQTDRPLYFPGETIWFKSYITNAENKVSTLSELVYAELISPKGTVARDIRLSVNQGVAYGDFKIEDNWVGGLYKLRLYTNWMKNYGDEAYFEKEIIVQKVLSPNVLMKLEFEKKAYGKGAEVIAHFEAKSLKNIPVAHQEIKFEVNIKGSTFLSEITKTDAKGKKDLVFRLPDTLNTTDVLLNVLVPYKSTRESIARSVPVTLNNIDLQFFPESGKALTGIYNQIAFKAVDEFGKSADISGDIFDADGKSVTTFSSFHDGMGSFQMMPTEQKYYAKITAPFKSDSLIALPKIHTKGTTFNIVEKKKAYVINVYSTNYNTLDLKVSNAYKALFAKEINLSKNKATYKLNKDELPAGIVKISLKNYIGGIVAERLVYANASRNLKIDVSLDKEVYETREKVRVKIKTTDAFNKPVPANLSVSIADNKIVSFADDKQDNILSYLLLSSELKGKIHKPSFYFDPKEEKATQGLNYVMLTHGWRTYLDTNDITLANAIHQPDVMATQYGKVVDKNYKAVKAHLLLFDQNTDKVLKFDTDDQGKFSFKLAQSNNLVLIAYTDDHQSVRIIKERFVKSAIKKSKHEVKDKASPVEFKELDIENPMHKKVKEEVLSSNKLGVQLGADNLLEEVVVIGYGIQRRNALTGSVTKIVDNGSTSALNVNNIAQALQGSVAGVSVINGDNIYGSRSNIVIRGSSSLSGNSQPLFIIDGVPYHQNNTSGDVLQRLESSNVEQVTVLKGASASALYGSSGINGVILITTKHQNFNRLSGSKSLNNKKYRNYSISRFYNYNSVKTYQSKKFYAPLYTNKVVPKDRTDFRQTLYWNPVVQTDKNGEATFEVYNSDAITSFIMTTEGIGYNGLVGRDETTYATKKYLNIDFKTPNYMALNDTIRIPVIVSNESSETIKANLKIELPKELKLLEDISKTPLQLAANSNVTRTITIVPIQKTEKSVINISVLSKKYADVIKKEVTVISPFFPTQASITGFKNDTYQFDVNNVVAGSIKADFTIYTDIVGNVMDGIESLIRQPYGCFEQASSVTYPNILILKYLQETGKSNPDIEKKAMEYIKQGYKKLAGFETAQNGFEWFGNTPPHETLSAYGVLEFTEMKAVYDGVDQKMIDRTVRWLLSRRDGKGGFKKSMKGYDSFTGSTKVVANAYIVYALSESGVEASIDKEYNAAYKEALKSNDSYRMAMMALASMNLGKKEQAKIMMLRLKENIKIYGFEKLPVKSTITRSNGDSKIIETMAFNLLALLKEGQSDFLVRQGIDALLSKRKHRRFGSTQATSMALKTLIAYTRSIKEKIVAENSVVNIEINKKKIEAALNLTDEGKVVIDLDQFIKAGQQNVKVEFSNAEVTFPFSLNVEWDSTIPDSSSESKVSIETDINNAVQAVGQNFRMNIRVTNKTDEALPMATAIIGIPSGASVQPWQLKEILEKNKVAYYEVFDNYLVFYWRAFDVAEVKEIQLDLKAEVAGKYKAPASTVYLYYADEHKHWIEGNQVLIK